MSVATRLKVFLCGCLLLTSGYTQAQLVIEITKGQANATPIAIVPLGWDAASPAPFDVSTVVEADLRRSGQFAPMDRRDMIDRPTAGAEIRFQEWKSLLKSDYIMVGKLLPDGADRYQVQYELYNALNGQRLVGERIPSTTANLRATAHRVADKIYEQLTGVRGAFATRIAFLNVEGTAPNQRYRLIVADADGENQRTIADSPEPIMSPAWSPDGQSLAYVSFENKSAMIYVQTLGTGERRRVSARAGLNGAPAWSPDGRTLALTLSRKEDIDVYTLDLASQLPTRMSFDPGIDTEPTWSADGKKLYFTSDRSGGAQIYEVEVADQRSPRRVTFDGSYNARPRVSPDGKKLAMIHRDNGNDRIAVMDIANKSLQVLTNGRNDESPSFAPNGAIVIYATQEKGRGVLKTVSADGRVEGRIATTRGDAREPVWGPFTK